MKVVLKEDVKGSGKKGELVEVADEEHLHASERQAMAVAHMTQDGIDSVQQVGSDHTHFVYHQQLHVTQQAQFGLPQLHLCEELRAGSGSALASIRGWTSGSGSG